MTFDIHALVKSICVDPIVEAQRIATDCEGEPRVERLTVEPERPAFRYYERAEKPLICDSLERTTGKWIDGYYRTPDATVGPDCIVVQLAFGGGTACVTHTHDCEAARAVATNQINTRRGAGET